MNLMGSAKYQPSAGHSGFTFSEEGMAKDSAQAIKDCMQKNGWDKNKCKKYLAALITNKQDFMSPSPSDVHVAGGIKNAKIEGIPKTQGFTFEAIPVFKAGTWKGREYSIADLDEIVRNTNSLIKSNKHTPPLKLGHNEAQELLKNDGLPNAGFGVNFYRNGSTIFCEFADMPQMVADLVQAKRYSEVSIELYDDFVHPDTQENIGLVIRAIALLGADIPAVKGLGDIHKIFHSEGGLSLITFAENELKEDSMDWTRKEIETIGKEKFPCCYGEVVKFMDDNKLASISASKLGEFISDSVLKKYADAPAAAEPKCPETFKWDAARGECLPVDQSAGVQNKPAEERHVCPEGMQYDAEAKTCVEVQAASDKPNKAAKEGADGKPAAAAPVDNPDAELDMELCDTIAGGIQPGKKYGELDEAGKKSVDEMRDNIKKVVAKHKKAPADVPADKLDDASAAKVKEIAAKDPSEWTDEEAAYMAAHAQGAIEAVYAEFKAKKAKAIASAPTDATPKAAPVVPGTTPADKKYSELEQEVKRYKKEKIDAMFAELKTKNREIFLPCFDGYIQTFSDALSEQNKVVKFNDAEIDLLGLFKKFMTELAKRKQVIFSELAHKKVELENISVEADAIAKESKKFSDAKPGFEIRNAELTLMAEKISKAKNIPFRDALLAASKEMKAR